MGSGRASTLTFVIILVWSLTSCLAQTPPEVIVAVYTGGPSYEAQSVTEFPWYDTLQAANRGRSDGGDALYALAYGKRVQLIRTDSVVPSLEPLIGEKFFVRGKLVGTRDYTPVAPGSKLWPATVATFEGS